MLEYIFDFDYIIDVRSPREFAESHIPNALNFPVFSDSEFEKIGILYKQNSIEANFLGASIACKNISNILDKNRDILNHKNKILIYCAKGGNRSLSLYQVLKSLKLRVERMDGGYKAYRKFVVNFLESPINQNFLTLCGNTGCGKSELIQMSDSWSVDLEKLCVHYGSSFGFMAGIQPSAKMFQNMLVSEFHTKKSKILLIENESKKLGNLILPNTIYKAYQDSKKILITCNLENRINRILKLYKEISSSDFDITMKKITPYISKEIKNEILNSFKNNDKYKVVELLLTKYYDKAYKKPKYDFVVNSDNLSLAYDEISNIREKIVKTL